METKLAIIYLVRLHAGGKYVGVTTRGIEKRWNQHCSTANGGEGYLLHNGIREYGIAAFTIEELYRSTDIEHTLKVKENEFIVEHKTHVSEGGYNLTMGGEGSIGHVHSAEARQKMSVSKMGHVHSAEARQKMSVAKMGHVPSEETCRKISDEAKGRKRSVEFKRKISDSLKGRVFSTEHRRKISESLKGKVRSEEHCRKISESLKNYRLSLNFLKKIEGCT